MAHAGLFSVLREGIFNKELKIRKIKIFFDLQFGLISAIIWREETSERGLRKKFLQCS